MYIPFHLIIPSAFCAVGVFAVILLQAINYFTGKKIDKWTFPAIIILATLAVLFYGLGNQNSSQFQNPSEYPDITIPTQ